MTNSTTKSIYISTKKNTDELIEIWQTNNRAKWSDMTFNVIRIILQERHVEIPPQKKLSNETEKLLTKIEPVIETAENHDKKERPNEKDEISKFNWGLPLLGAIGFGIGFALMSGIMLTIYHHALISTSRVFSEKIDLDIIKLGAFRGILAGCIGGVGLGLAHKDKSRIFYLSLAGAIGFGWAFVLVIASDVIWDIGHIIWDIRRAIISLNGNSTDYVYVAYDATLAQGVGMGSVVGGIGGLVLGLALPKYRVIASFLLSLAGILSFSFVFTVGAYLFDGSFFSSWNAWGGIVGGASLGMALALYYKISSWIQQWQS